MHPIPSDHKQIARQRHVNDATRVKLHILFILYYIIICLAHITGTARGSVDISPGDSQDPLLWFFLVELGPTHPWSQKRIATVPPQSNPTVVTPQYIRSHLHRKQYHPKQISTNHTTIHQIRMMPDQDDPLPVPNRKLPNRRTSTIRCRTQI